MARTRNIRPGFFTNETLCRLAPLTRLLFAGLWTVADREGRVLDRPARLKAELFPYDHVSVERGLQQLAAAGFIQRYSSDGSACIQLMSWYKHQKPHPREEASRIPAPAGFLNSAKPDLGATTAVPEAGLRSDHGQASSSSSSSSSIPSRNSLREDPPTPQNGGRKNGRRRKLEFDEDGPRYEQRMGANGKREWVEVEA